MSYTIKYDGNKYKCSRWLKNKILNLEKIKNRTGEQELGLLFSYRTAMHIPFYYELSDDQIKLNKKITQLGIKILNNKK